MQAWAGGKWARETCLVLFVRPKLLLAAPLQGSSQRQKPQHECHGHSPQSHITTIRMHYLLPSDGLGVKVKQK